MTVDVLAFYQLVYVTIARNSCSTKIANTQRFTKKSTSLYTVSKKKLQTALDLKVNIKKLHLVKKEKIIE